MSVADYLNGYAEHEYGKALFESLAGDNPFAHVLCIPACAEAPDFLDRMLADVREISVLVIMVANAPDNADEGTLRLSRELTDQCRAKYALIRAGDDDCCLLSLDRDKQHSLLLVDRTRPGHLLPASQGVGLARKIACDIACRQIAAGRIATPWINTTDADAILPGDYFTAIDRLDPELDAAGIYPFRHTAHPDEKLRQAQRLYDASLHYYVEGLRWAGSGYAFHTVGSTLVINYRHYALTRGFPRRPAGEDFYLLNKLAKVGRIVSLETSPLLITSRLSGRVPFGTGPALKKILQLEYPEQEFLFYHPHCFIYLKCWLALSKLLWPRQKEIPASRMIDELMHGMDCDHRVDAGILSACLESLGVAKALDHAFGHSKEEKVFHRHLHNWFDAFITLKFIHWLRDNHLPSQPLAFIRDEKTLPFAHGLVALAPVVHDDSARGP